MKLLLGFLPFALFAVVEHYVALVPALLVAVAVAGILILREGRPRLLEVGAVGLFGGLAAIALATGADWSILEVRLIVDAGLFVLVAGALALGHPFTLPYARAQVPARLWTHPKFIHKNVVITAAWIGSLAVHAIADAAMLAGLPIVAGAVLSIVALGAAAAFTVHNAK